MSALPIEPTEQQLETVWVLGDGDGLRAVFDAGVEAERARAAAETTEEWGVRYDNDSTRRMEEEQARWTTEGIPWTTLVRRLVGPWEVQS